MRVSRNRSVRPLLAKIILFSTCSLLFSCSDSAIEERLSTLTGNDYLALSRQERSQIVADSLERFTTWRFWERPDICDSLLNQEALATLFYESAEAAGDNLLMFNLAHLSNEECIRRQEMFK